MSENYVAHFTKIVCAILAISMRNSNFLTTQNILDAKIAHYQTRGFPIL